MDGVTIHTDQQARIGSDKSYTYYSATLPDEIQDLFDLEKGSAVLTSLERSSVEGEEYRYLEITWPPADEDTEADSREYDIRYSDDTFHIRFKPNWTRDIKESPFYQIEEEDGLCVELNELDPAIRVFQPEDASLRTKELGLEDIQPSLKEPIVDTTGPVFEGSEYTDLLKYIPYKGQKFEFIPFDAQSDVFTKRDSVSASYIPTVSTFQEARDQDQLPQREVRKLTIKWSREAVLTYHDDDWTGREVNGSDQEIIYTYDSVNEAKVILPCMGEFEISTVTEYGKNGTWLTYVSSGPESHQRHIGDNWFSKYYKNPEDEDAITIYIPCNSQ
jgi:hypothetical protein